MVTIGQKLNDFAHEISEKYGRNVTQAQAEEIRNLVDGFQKKRNGKSYVWIHDLGNGEFWVCFDCYSGGFHAGDAVTFRITA